MNSLIQNEKSGTGIVRIIGNILLVILCLSVLGTIFLNFISIRLPVENEIFKAVMEKIGMGNGEFSFSVYEMLRGLSSVEYGWSLLKMPVEDIRMLMFWILAPYALTVICIILACLRGRWKYPVISVISVLSILCMIFTIIMKLPVLLSSSIYHALDTNSLALIEMVTGDIGEQIRSFFQNQILRYLREGFWLCVVLLTLICVVSLIFYVISGKKTGHKNKYIRGY